MSILKNLKSEHEALKNLLANFDSVLEDYNQRRDYLKTLSRLFVAYSYAKEKNFYRPLRKKKEARLRILQSMEVHILVDQLIWQLEEEDLVEEEWYVKFKTMVMLVFNIINHDENDAFTLASQLLKTDTLNHLGYTFQEDKARLQRVEHRC